MIAPLSVLSVSDKDLPQVLIGDAGGTLRCIVLGFSIEDAQQDAQEIIQAVNSAALLDVVSDLPEYSTLVEQVDTFFDSGRAGIVRERITAVSGG